MCGIAGFIDQNGSAGPEQLTEIAKAMADALAHRGPDDAGTWADPSAGVALGHRRLSVLDLSQEGHQPMHSPDGRFCLTYNGEIYNYGELRNELDKRGRVFRGNSDTEVMLAAFQQWGVEEALRRFIGIFAFGLWDKEQGLLYLARDHLGVKPLYYGISGKSLLFGSELKALRAHPDFSGSIDRRALARFLRFGYVGCPDSIYEGIRKLPPGSLLVLDPSRELGTAEPKAFWSPWEAMKRSNPEGAGLGEEETLEALDALLRDAVRLQMVADVPVGAFLSGGVDSSLVVALMRSASPRRIKTFTVGFEEARFNEAGYARAVARHLECDHTEMTLSWRETREAIPDLPAVYDEPFADVSQIPTLLVSRLARRSVTVSLSGDGGDELFGGYSKYVWARRIWRGTGWLPFAVRRMAGAGLSTLPERWIDRAFGVAANLFPRRERHARPGELVHKTARLLAGASRKEAYRELQSLWSPPEEVILEGVAPVPYPRAFESGPEGGDFAEWMMRVDLSGYLPDDILVKLDRASMAVALEGRVPLLDHRVAEFALRLPLDIKIRNGEGKWPLRRLAERHVPKELLDRPKAGFGVPIGDWLRGPLRDWAEDLLDESRLNREGLLDSRVVRGKWRSHKAGKRNWQHQLWAVLMFQSWLESSRMGK